MEPEDTGCQGGWDGKGSLEGLLGSPSALRAGSLLPPILLSKDSLLLFSHFPSKMVAPLGSEPPCQ